MPIFFFDTSALIKYYHTEVGTESVSRVFAGPRNYVAISKLSSIEFHSATAKKHRSDEITAIQYHSIANQFRKDRTMHRFRVVRLTVPHYNFAESLVHRIAPSRNLRTLDALQLSVALGLNSPEAPITFVCSDTALCSIAAAEGLAVLNPEVDPPA